MNPFELSSKSPESLILNWQQMTGVPYDKNAVDPYTRCRVILMNGTEFEAVWYSHQFSRHCSDNELRRQIALLRRLEQQQQKLVASLKPADEAILAHTIGYEQLAVDLTAALAQREDNPYVKQALDFALLEDFDHLYRYADLMEFDDKRHAEELVGRYTEIMPGRPTIAHHRHPYDSVKFHIRNRTASPQTRLCTAIITAAEQQTMNYYMNVAGFYPTAWGQKLYREIGMVEEQHVTQYGSLQDTDQTWLEGCLNHQYTECYLYWSAMETETDPRIRDVWAQLFEQEVSHLHFAAELLETYEGKEAAQIIPDGAFPDALRLTGNIEYVRGVLGGTVCDTALREDWTNVNDLNSRADFFRYQGVVNADIGGVESHAIIERVIDRDGTDYRFETAPNPVPALRSRTQDNTSVGRVQGTPC
ncbi:MAG: hypothetical protein IJ124_04585 [Clostridia bacterium]|nr:hypothetical protein [Clostridia bacterium]